MEQWKDIIYEKDYQISNLGRIKSFKWGKERILKPSLSKKGYLNVILNRKNYLVHRLVAEAFLPNPDNLPCVNHKDEDKSNNIVNNLEWCDVKYNQNYGTRNTRIGKSNTNGKLSKPVLQYTLDGQFVKEWSSTMECKRNGYNQSHIIECCRKNRKTHKGFKWGYKDEQ